MAPRCKINHEHLGARARLVPLAFLCSAFAIVGLAACKNTSPGNELQFHASDFGAVANDGVCDGDAIRACIQAALASERPAEILFDAGEYRVDAAPGEKMMGESVALPIRDARNIAVLGSEKGTILVITDPSTSGIVFDGCSNVVLKNMQIDYDPLPYAFGSIRSVDMQARTFDLELDEGSIGLRDSAFAKAKTVWGMVVRPDQAHDTVRYGPVVVRAQAVIPLSERVWRLEVGPATTEGYGDVLLTSGMKPGDRFVYMPRTYGSAVGIQHCENTEVNRVTIFASPGLCFFPYLSRGVSLIDCHVDVRGSRLLSANADGVHARGLRGDLLIEGCSFEGMADDAINIHSSAIVVREVLSPQEVSVEPHSYTVLPGDTLVAYSAESMGSKGQATVAAVEKSQDRLRIRLTDPLNDLRGGGANDDADRFYNLSEAGGPFLVKNCRFLAHRGRGVLVSAVNGAIEDNVFENNEGWGIHLNFGDARWAEGPPAKEIRINKNTFYGKGGSQPAVSIHTHEAGFARCFSELRILNNRFESLSAPAVRLQGVVGALLENNSVTTATPPSGTWGFAAIEIRDSSDIDIERLDVEPAGLSTDVLIEATVDADLSAVRIKGNAVRIADRRTTSVTE